MNASQREYFRRRLLRWRDELLRESNVTLQHLQEESVQSPDLADRASAETDRAVELRVVSVDDARGLAVCADQHGGRAEVDVLLVAPAAPGEQLLVHAGPAIARAAAWS